MIRLLALLALTTLPAHAQDFRGLLPGMPVSDLARLGEPLSFTPQSGGLTEATYPLPFNQRLQVIHDGTRVLMLTSWNDVFALQPEADGFQAFRTTLEEAVDVAGSEGWFFDSEGQTLEFPPNTMYRIYYDLPEHPDVALALVFLGYPTEVELGPDDVARVDTPLDGDADFIQAELFHRDVFAQNPDQYGGPRIDRPGSAPFALPLSEAFPQTQIP